MPLPSYARVTNTRNGRSMIVRVNDRGPFHSDRVMDVSARVAEALGFKGQGTAPVRVEWVAKAGLAGSDDAKLYATLRTDGQPATLIGTPDESRPSFFANSPRPSGIMPTMASDTPTLAPQSPVNPMVAPKNQAAENPSQISLIDRNVIGPAAVETPMASMSLNLVPSPMPAHPPLPPIRPFDLGRSSSDQKLASRSQR
jgi:rare lipoprotein A